MYELPWSSKYLHGSLLFLTLQKLHPLLGTGIPFPQRVHVFLACQSSSFLSSFLPCSTPSIWPVFPHFQDSGTWFSHWSLVCAIQVPPSFPLASFWIGISFFSLRPSGVLSKFLRDSPNGYFCFPVISDHGSPFPSPSIASCFVPVVLTSPAFLFLTHF